MPHLVFKGPVTPEDIYLTFQPLELKEEGLVAKATECFLNFSKDTVLIRSMVSERSFPRNFFIKVTLKNEELTLKLEQLGAPERSDAVKRFLGFCGWVMMQSEPQLELVRGNIEEFIKAPDA